MKKRLKLKKVTLRDLDERTLGAVQGAGRTLDTFCDQSFCDQYGSCAECHTDDTCETCDCTIDCTIDTCMCTWEPACC